MTPQTITNARRHLVAFHGKPEIKAEYLARVQAHREADELVKGQYWHEGKGCAVGCTIHGSDHERYERELGIPWQLAVVEDRLFEAMPNADAMTWPQRFLESIPVGANLSLVGRCWTAWIVRDMLNIPALPDDKRACVTRLADLMDRSLAGDEPREVEWDTAARDARVAWAARDARDARDAWVAWAVWAAWAAWDDSDPSRASHATRYADRLLEFLRAAPVTITIEGDG